MGSVVKNLSRMIFGFNESLTKTKTKKLSATTSTQQPFQVVHVLQTDLEQDRLSSFSSNPTCEQPTVESDVLRVDNAERNGSGNKWTRKPNSDVTSSSFDDDDEMETGRAASPAAGKGVVDSAAQTGNGKCRNVIQNTDGDQKRVLFRDSVRVYKYSDTNQTSADINGHRVPEVTRETIRLSDSDNEEVNSCDSSSDNDNSTAAMELSSAPRRPLPPTCWTTSLDVVSDPVVRYHIARLSATGARVLRFSVSLGEAYGAAGSTVMVKASASGKKIHVLARCAAAAVGAPPSSRRRTSRDDGVYKDTFPLPVIVDPTQVSARVDSVGRLMVEGLVVSPSDPLLHRHGRHQSVEVP